MNSILNLGALGLLITTALMGTPERGTRAQAKPAVANMVFVHKPEKAYVGPSAPVNCHKDMAGIGAGLDPGHGGTDPGTNMVKWGKMVAEAPYALDISLRMKRTIECHGGIAVLTRRGEKIYDLPANEIIPFNRSDDLYTWNGAPVVAKKAGMTPRLRLGQEVLEHYPDKKVVWVSVHIDQAESSRQINGMHLLVPRSIADDDMTKSLLAKLQEEHRSRSYTKGNSLVESALFINEDERNVYILRGSNNPIALRFLVEVGNFAEAKDSYRIRDSFVREDYATLLVEGIVAGAS